jgi:hypothetical protein
VSGVVGVLVLGFAFLIVLLLCSIVRARLPVAFVVLALLVALTLVVTGSAPMPAAQVGGVVGLGGLVLGTIFDTNEELRLARRRAKPRRRRPARAVPRTSMPEVERRRRAA